MIICLQACFSVEVQAQIEGVTGLYIPPKVAKEYREHASLCIIDASRDKHLGVDRYGKYFTEIYCEADSVSYQEHMLGKGLALINMVEMGEYPLAWRKAQNAAREDRLGIWSSLEPISAEVFPNLSSQVSWAFIYGRVHSVTKRDFGTYINFASDWRTDFTLFIHKTHRRDFGAAWFDAIVGQEIEVMGFTYDSYGPMLDITHPSQVMFRK